MGTPNTDINKEVKEELTELWVKITQIIIRLDGLEQLLNEIRQLIYGLYLCVDIDPEGNN